MVGSNGVNRVTLSINLAHHTADELARKLAELSGVVDVTLILEEQTAYLKVDAQKFNLQQARRIVGENNN